MLRAVAVTAVTQTLNEGLGLVVAGGQLKGLNLVHVLNITLLFRLKLPTLIT